MSIYYFPITQFKRPIKQIQKYDIDIVSSRNNNLMNLLGNAKHKINETEKSGICQIQCEDCEKSYIYQTKRNV